LAADPVSIFFASHQLNMQTPSQVFIRSWVKRKIFRVEVDGVPHSFYSRATCPPVSSYDS